MRNLLWQVLILLDALLLISSADTTAHFVWSAWEPWITCSRSCGGGSSYQLRGCLRGTCRGPAIQYKTCNTQECPPNATDFRAQQCAAYNDVQYRDAKFYEWEPVDNLPRLSQCTLTCRAKGQDIIQVFSPKVLDGTRCTLFSRDMCINGKCEPVGCDYQLNSTAIVDRCGVCNGDNSTCKLMKGNNIVVSRAGTKDVYEIPAGSHSIRITNKGQSYLGIREVDGANGLNQLVATPLHQAQYSVAGVPVRYTRLRSGREHIDIDQPLQEPIIVTLLFTNPNPFTTSRDKFHYQYIAPLKHVWKAVGWSQCTATCGGGDELSVIVCIKVSTERPVPDSFCEGRRPDFERRRCNEVMCPPSWHPDPWEPCSRTCGGGIQTRRVYCVKRAPEGMVMRISEMMCSGTIPASQQACNMEMCPHWFPGPWTPCSATCGQGVITREVQCQDNSGLIAEGCDPAEKPAMERECTVRIPCIRTPEIIPERPRPQPQPQAQPFGNAGVYSPSWQAGEWGSCSATCNEGLRTRRALCKVYLEAWDSFETLPDMECRGQMKPAELEVCKEADCVEDGSNSIPVDSSSPVPYSSSGPLPFEWRYGGFTQCSASCLGGFQESIVECVSNFDDSPASDAFCDIDQRLPIVRKVCNEIPCPPEWMIPLYEECSTSCGGGVQLPKVVMCMEVVARGAGNTHVLSDDSCDGPKPLDPVPCNEVDCPAFWLVGPWSECSVTCNNGSLTRTVKCLQLTASGEEIEVDSMMCPQPAPSTKEMCMQEKCKIPAKWKPQEWSECSASCGAATRLRTIMCIEDNPSGILKLLDFRECPAESRPIDVESCNLPKCIEPVILANRTIIHQQQLASKMRFSVGSEAYLFEGTTITVKCPVRNFKKREIVWERGRTPVTTADRRVKVVNGGTLRIKHIRKADSGTYSCVAGSARESFTLHILEPRLAPQHVGPRWSIGPWSECTVSCGGGTQTRVVFCEKTTPKGKTKDNNPWVCKEKHSPQPESTRDCNIQGCQPHWKTGSWSECRGPRACLGPFESTQTREVYCEGGDANELASENCDEKTKPESIQNCRSEECRPVWQASDWSMCSASCGAHAVKTRKIQCIFKGTQAVADTKWCNMHEQPSVVQHCYNLPSCPDVPCENQSNYCSLVKRLNMCQLPIYQEQCCESCSSNG